MADSDVHMVHADSNEVEIETVTYEHLQQALDAGTLTVFDGMFTSYRFNLFVTYFCLFGMNFF